MGRDRSRSLASPSTGPSFTRLRCCNNYNNVPPCAVEQQRKHIKGLETRPSPSREWQMNIQVQLGVQRQLDLGLEGSQAGLFLLGRCGDLCPQASSPRTVKPRPTWLHRISTGGGGWARGWQGFQPEISSGFWCFHTHPHTHLVTRQTKLLSAPCSPPPPCATHAPSPAAAPPSPRPNLPAPLPPRPVAPCPCRVDVIWN